MKITIFDIRKTMESDLLVEKIEELYRNGGEKTEIKVYHPDKTEIKDCIGCWSCWLKTPGKCALKDQTSELYKDYIDSDEVVLLFHTVNGFIDGKGKTFIDRLIPHYLPYIQLSNGECVHKKRYDKYPTMNIYFEKDDLSNEETEVIRSYFARTAYHFKSSCKEILYENGKMQMVERSSTKPKQEILAQKVTERKTGGKWVIYNGSPRAEHSNSKLLIEKIVEGMRAKGIKDIEIRNLINTKEHELWAEQFSSVENNLFVFPLYVHAMPGSVMKFFERLKPVKEKKVHMAFFVQSGFPETSQSYYLRPYLELLTKRLGASFDGIIIKAGMEGIQRKPEKANEKLFDQMELLGSTYAEKGIMDLTLIKEYEKAAHLSKGTQFLFAVFSLTGLTNSYWDYSLKNNGAYEKRFAKPYAMEAGKDL
jgi:Multimeric flavodoxin WrbA